MLIGGVIAGRVYNGFLGTATDLTLDQFAKFWPLPAGFAAVVLVLFALFFRPQTQESSRGSPTEPRVAP